MIPAKRYRITVLEDNEFYNRLLSKQLKNYTDIISAQKNYDFEISSFMSPHDFLANLKEDTDIAFVDFYLGSLTALEIITKIREKCRDCKIIVISQVRNPQSMYNTISLGALEFIYKDTAALARSCFIVEDIINSTPGHNTHLYN
jgi:DNA-binding NarL/FixJ family response regulator